MTRLPVIDILEQREVLTVLLGRIYRYDYLSVIAVFEHLQLSFGLHILSIQLFVIAAILPLIFGLHILSSVSASFEHLLSIFGASGEKQYWT